MLMIPHEYPGIMTRGLFLTLKYCGGGEIYAPPHKNKVFLLILSTPNHTLAFPNLSYLPTLPQQYILVSSLPPPPPHHNNISWSLLSLHPHPTTTIYLGLFSPSTSTPPQQYILVSSLPPPPPHDNNISWSLLPNSGLTVA